MEFRRVYSWLSDDMPKTTEAVAYVSKCGVVKVGSYVNWSKKNQDYRKMPERYPKVRYDKRGDRREQPEWKSKYKTVALRGKTFRVHRLVALAWVPNPESKPFVNHKNGIRDDNRASNLEWVTHQENVSHAAEMGLTARGEKNAISLLTNNQVKALKNELKHYKRGDGIRLSEKYGVSRAAISSIKVGRNWGHV